MTVYWVCIHCPETGTTTGTESDDDAKHVAATKHTTLAGTDAKLLARAVEKVGRL